MKRLVLLFFLCISYSQTRYGDGKGNGIWRGRPCDDTEVRGYSGLPAWKNYGEWLSECDSLADAYEDSTFAIILEERHSKKLEEDRKRQEEIDNIDIDAEFDINSVISIELEDVSLDELKEWGFPSAKLLPIPGK